MKVLDDGFRHDGKGFCTIVVVAGNQRAAKEGKHCRESLENNREWYPKNKNLRTVLLMINNRCPRGWPLRLEAHSLVFRPLSKRALNRLDRASIDDLTLPTCHRGQHNQITVHHIHKQVLLRYFDCLC